jgi:putative DNA methylase
LKPYVGHELTVIAWLWARTVESSNPAYRRCHVPLVSSFWLSTKPGKETWIEPLVDGKTYRFEVRTGKPRDKAMVDAGTKLGRGANFRCVLSQSPLSPDYIKAEGMAGRMSARLMSIVCESDQGRVYLPPIPEHEQIARQAKPEWKPETQIANDPRALWTPSYGLTTYGDLFTPRQLVALTTLSVLVAEAVARARHDAVAAGLPEDAKAFREGGTCALAYAEATGVYLGFCLDKATLTNTTQASWQKDPDRLTQAFGRQGIPMVWDFAEANPLSGAGGGFGITSHAVGKVLERLPVTPVPGDAAQEDAVSGTRSRDRVISTDPPYYDNIGYADLSDYFYVWMRKTLRGSFPDLFGTLAVPKAEELVATPYRHGSKEKAECFFLEGMTRAMHRIAEHAHPVSPVTIYYAFKQSEGDDTKGTANTGWETFLDAVIRAGLAVCGTWPMRTELIGNLKKNVSALASSIVLVCRPRPSDAPTTTRKDFLVALRRELPSALRHLQEGNIAPVDLAQASIGPGMAVFTRYSRILESDGKPMTVRTGLQLINQTLDEVLAEQEGDFDPETAWAVAWFDQFGFNDGPFGDAETLSKAKNTALNALVEAGLVKSGAGKTRLLRVDELPKDWDPATDKRLTVWEMVHHLIRVMNAGGETAAAGLVAKLGPAADTARELAYRLYHVCERRKRAQEALGYNALVQAWPELVRLSRETVVAKTPLQGELL